MANAFDVNIIIIEMERTDIRFNKVGRNADNPSILPLVVLKREKHYDGLIYLHSRTCHKPPKEGPICESFEFGKCAPNDIIYCSNEDGAPPLKLFDESNALNDYSHTYVILNSQCSAIEGERFPRLSEHAPSARPSTMSSKPQTVRITSRDINGLSGDKLYDEILGTFLQNFDLILLTETWACADVVFEVKGFTCHNYPRHYKHPNARRDSGGIGVFIRNDIKNAVVVGKIHDDVLTGIKLDATYFGLEKDLYVGNIYVAPQGSVHMRDDVFSVLYKEKALLNNESNVILCCDYNAHTGVLPDYDIETLHGSEGDLVNLLPNDGHKQYDDVYKLHITGHLKRYPKDSRPGAQGLQLIDFSKNTGLLLMNGRIGLDKGVGEYTRMGICGGSMIDYVIESPAIFETLHEFEIGRKLPESDHLPVVFAIKRDSVCRIQLIDHDHWDKQWIYHWTNDDLPAIRLALCDATSRSLHVKVTDTLADHKCTNAIAAAFNSYIEQTCQRACQVS